MKDIDMAAAIAPVVDAFERIGVTYCIGGSVASSIYGTARTTMDVDMVSDLKPEHVRAFVQALETAYYVDEPMIRDAISRFASFNLIHLETMIKIDVFISRNAPYDIETFKRRRKDVLDEEQRAIEVYLVSPEDIVLNKLSWFLLGGGVSERQWTDVLGVLKVQKTSLNGQYLQYWARELELEELLKKAFRDAGIEASETHLPPQKD